jgi:hypothetical protein
VAEQPPILTGQDLSVFLLSFQPAGNSNTESNDTTFVVKTRTGSREVELTFVVKTRTGSREVELDSLLSVPGITAYLAMIRGLQASLTAFFNFFSWTYQVR